MVKYLTLPRMKNKKGGRVLAPNSRAKNVFLSVPVHENVSDC